eukprot:CAMPEP_0119556148 /NCGR_PEP_ID=MMETSP1352-20130426/8184_1 /TAXON_ID=265584 /ORGANISM="Stauroneis constricta, Strain CCMP1120" /LENGTH=127 /DNA_ID=CAMNT_0007603051 /DNA_START=176 /DNA_END=559 /DNA_ORIENTATION=+
MTRQATNFYLGLFPFTLVFWIWALKNTIGMDAGAWDWGVASFGMVLVTTAYVLGTRSADGLPYGLPRILVTASHVLVAMNYIVGAIIGFHVLHRPMFGTYCVTFVFVWLGIAWYGREVIVKAEGSLD